MRTCTEQVFLILGFANTQVAADAKGIMNRLMQGSPDGMVIPDFIEIELEVVGTAPASDIVGKLSQLTAVTEVSVVDDAD